MPKNLKFHAIAITTITLLVLVIYSTTKPAPTAATPGNGNAIAISSASWGRGCNAAIEEARIARSKKPIDASQKEPPLVPVAPDNALKGLQALCEGKPSCSFKITSQALGVEPMDACFKRLEATYRCFAFDRPRRIDRGQGDQLRINCIKPDAPDEEKPKKSS